MFYRETIFITGFPGFIASRLIERMADGQTQFYILVQPQFIEMAMEEIRGSSVLTVHVVELEQQLVVFHTPPPSDPR